MPGSPAHLVRRFFDVLTARPLGESERDAVLSWLSGPLAEIFFSQPPADQSHGYHAALSVVESGRAGSDAVVAALLHDVGKRHSRLGVLGRSLASVMILARLPLTDRLTAYRDHGLVGARELAAAGAPGLAVDFALHHHGRRPPTIPETTWDILVGADQPAKALGVARTRITSKRR